MNRTSLLTKQVARSAYRLAKPLDFSMDYYKLKSFHPTLTTLSFTMGSKSLKSDEDKG